MPTNTNMCVFNKYIEPFTKDIIYKKHVIDNVFWDDIEAVILSSGFNSDDKVDVFIPFDKNDLSEYKEPKKYNGTGWTLREGDFIIKGDVPEAEVNGIKDLSAYETFEITEWSKKDFGSYNMQHFEVRGK